VIRLRIDRATAEFVTDLIVLALDLSPAAAELAREGVHEYELAAALDYAFRRRGAAGPAYENRRVGVSGCISRPVRQRAFRRAGPE
jgi:hypothetical protein